MDGAYVLAGAVIPERMHLLPHADPARPLVALPHQPVAVQIRRRHLLRKDDQLRRRVHRLRLLEQPEGGAGDDLDLLETVQPPARGREAIRRLLGCGRRQEDEEGVPGNVPAALPDLEREGGRARLPVLHREADERRRPGDGHVREPPLHLDALDGALGEDAGDDDAGKEQAEDEEEQVVARVHRGEADADGEADVPASDTGEAEPATPGRSPGFRLRPSLRICDGALRCRDHTGTGTCSAISRMARSVASRSRPGRMPP